MSPRVLVIASFLTLAPASAFAVSQRVAGWPPHGSASQRTHRPVAGRLALPNPKPSSTPDAASVGRAPAASRTVSAPDGSGGQFYAWPDFRDGSSDTYVLRVTANGVPASGWPADGVAVCNAPGEQFPAAVLPDSMGGAIVLFYDSREAFETYDLAAQRIDHAGTVKWAINGVKLLAIDNDITYAPSVAPDGTGGLLIAWASGVSDPNIYASRFTNTGARAAGWDTSGVLVCGDPNPQDQPVVAPDGLGGAYVSWLDNRDISGNAQVFARRISTGGNPMWTADGIRLDLGPTGKYVLGMTDELGDALVFWSTGDSIQGQRINDTGAAAWAAGGATVATGVVAVSSDFRAGPDGTDGALLAWHAFPAGVQGYQAQRVAGDGSPLWGAGGVSLVDLAGSFPNNLEIATDAAGSGFFAWIDRRNGTDYDIYAQHVGPTGTVSWTVNGAPVTTADDHQLDPRIVYDGAGGLQVMFIDGGGPFDAYRTQRLDASGAKLLGVDGVDTYRDPGTQGPPMVLHTADGGVLTAWTEKRPGSGYDVRARKLDANGVPTGPGSIVTDAPGDQILTAMITDGAGGAILAWTSELLHDQSDLYAQRIDGDALPQWTANGVAVSALPGWLEPPVAASDDAGGIILAWIDFRDDNDPDLYAQRISATGVAQWTADGINVCPVNGELQSPGIVADEAGGAILAWVDYRNSLPQVYGQRLDGTGAPQWTVGGTLIADYTGGSSVISLVANEQAAGNGGIFLVREFKANLVPLEFSDELHAVRVGANGAPLWGPQGTTVVDAGSLIPFAHIIGDGVGGVFVAWSDSRGLGLDIYGQRLDPSGAPLWTANGRSLCNAASYQVLGGITRNSSGLMLTWTDYRGFDSAIFAHLVNGAGDDVWAANGVVVGNAQRGQFFATVSPFHADLPERFYVGWCDNRLAVNRQAVVQRLDANGAAQWTADGVTDVAVSVIGASAEGGSVRIAWLTDAGVPATVYRRAAGGTLWASIGRVAADGSGLVAFEDRDVIAGARYAYRLGVAGDAGEIFSAEAWVDVPAAALGLNRVAVAAGRASVEFTLPREGPASFEWIDIAGRRAGGRQLAGLGAGVHTIRFETPPGAGVYFLRLTQDASRVAKKVAIVN